MNIFPSLQSWYKILVLVIGQCSNFFITFISSIAEAFNMSWFTKWFPDCLVFPVSLPYVVGQSGPRVAYSAWARSLLPPPPSTSGPFYPMSLFAPHPCPAAISRGNISQDLAPTKYGISQVIAIMWSVPDVPEVFVIIKNPADFYF